MPLSHAPAKKALRIIPLGGLGEIGLNCMVFEYDDELLVVDCGVMFSDLQMLGVDFVIPDMTYLRENKDRIAGYVITHGHEDHIGALPFAMKAHPAPIYCTRFAHRLVEAKLAEHGLDRKTEFRVFAPGDTIRFRHFSVTPVPVNHSIVESMALFIDTPLGKVVFTGDFKMDSNPYYGSPMDPKPFQKAGGEGVLLLMSDSTNVERDGHSLSEKRIYHKFEELFAETKGLTVIAVFASNIGRIGQVVEIARKLGRKIAFMGRSMEQNARLARELGYLDGLEEVLIGIDDIEKHGRDRCIVLSTGSQGEYRSGLMRVANNEHRAVKLREGDLVIMSSKFIPGNEKAIGRMINDLFRLGAEVLYEPLADIHVSGHANSGELRAMLKMTKPKFFVPVHGEYRHLVHHKKLALETNVEKGNAFIAVNGDILEIDAKGMAIVAHMEENRVLIEGEGGKDVNKVILKDRRKVAETGIVFSVLIRNRVSGKIMAGPDIISRGLLEESLMGDLFDKAKETVIAILGDCDAVARGREVNVQEEIRVGLRRFFQARIGKKPVVVPVLIDV